MPHILQISSGQGPAECQRFVPLLAPIIEHEARAAGLKNCWVTLVGWIKDGHDGAYPLHFPVNERAGGEAKLDPYTQRMAICPARMVPRSMRPTPMRPT